MNLALFFMDLPVEVKSECDSVETPEEEKLDEMEME